MKEILNNIEEDPKSYEFREPVPWKELGLLDYPEIIKKAMDLQTCRKHLSKGKYKRYEDFFKDLLLIWDNCKQYNIQGSDIYKQAEYMERVSKKQIGKFKEEVGMGGGTKKGGKTKGREEGKRGSGGAGEDDEEEEMEVDE